MRFDKKMLLGAAVGAAALAGAIALMKGPPSRPAPKSYAEDAARRVVEAMYREARALAEAEAKAKEELRDAELQAAEEMLNLIDSDPEASPDLLGVEGLPETVADSSRPEGQQKSPEVAGELLSRDPYTKRGTGKEAPEAPEEPPR